ncbi:MAG: dimethyl sulfoxide reductase anchor subunit family protein [Gammaproteobacteria bacterium]
MRPSASIIFFTVTAGAGYGLFMAAVAAFHLSARLSPRAQLISCAVALVLVTAGLCSSTLHLANPKNARLALSRVKTSWLSREGVLALAFFPAALLYLLAAWLSDGESGVVLRLLGILCVVLAVATVLATGMIYACLRTIRQWRTPLTPLNYLLLALMQGALLAGCIQTLCTPGVAITTVPIIFLLALGFLGKLAYYLVIGPSAGPSINTATRFERASVKLLDVGHTAGNFLTHEFGFQLEPRSALALRIVALALACWVPALLIIPAGPKDTSIWVVAAGASYAGVLIERWLFFAEGRHVVNLFHGAQRT